MTVGALFRRTHVALPKWFILIAMMLNAKKSISSCLAIRDLGMRQSTVWSMMNWTRAAMLLDPEQKKLLQGIVEDDEAYVEQLTHINGIEGFSTLLKPAWYSQRQHYGEKYTLLYLAEACWKFNNRGKGDTFKDAMELFCREVCRAGESRSVASTAQSLEVVVARDSGLSDNGANQASPYPFWSYRDNQMRASLDIRTFAHFQMAPLNACFLKPEFLQYFDKVPVVDRGDPRH